MNDRQHLRETILRRGTLVVSLFVAGGTSLYGFPAGSIGYLGVAAVAMTVGFCAAFVPVPGIPRQVRLLSLLGLERDTSEGAENVRNAARREALRVAVVTLGCLGGMVLSVIVVNAINDMPRSESRSALSDPVTDPKVTDKSRSAEKAPRVRLQDVTEAGYKNALTIPIPARNDTNKSIIGVWEGTQDVGNGVDRPLLAVLWDDGYVIEWGGKNGFRENGYRFNYDGLFTSAASSMSNNDLRTEYIALREAAKVTFTKELAPSAYLVSPPFTNEWGQS